MKRTISLIVASFISIPAIITICVACAFLSAFIYNQKIDYFKNDVEHLYTYIETTYEDQITRIKSIVDDPTILQFVENPSNEQYRQEVAGTIFDTFNIEDQVLELYLVAPNGDILISTNQNILEPDQKSTLVFQKVVETKQPFTTLKFSGSIPLLKIGYPILSGDELKAIYIRYTPLNYVAYFAKNINNNDESIYLITDDNSGVFYNSMENDSVTYFNSFDDSSIPESVSSMRDILTLPPDSRDNSGTVNFFVDNQSVVGYYQILDSLNWICMISQPRAIILYDLNVFQLLTLLVSLVFIVIVNIAVRRYFNRYVDSFESFIQTANDFENGDRGVRFKDFHLPEGITKLGEQLNEILEENVLLVKKNEALTQQIDTMQNIDPITKLENNRSLYQEIDSKFGQDPNQVLIMFNTGVYDQINETFGNSVVNRLLEVIAEIVNEFLTDRSVAARLTQDNFCIFVEKFDDINDIHEKMNELRLRLEAISRIDDLEVQLYPNIVAVFRDDRLFGRSDWLRLATEVLNNSKQKKGSFTIFDFTNITDINHTKPEYIQNILFNDGVAVEGFSRSEKRNQNEEE